MKQIILASGSPRRKQLLEWAGLDFKIVISDAPEDFPESMITEDVPEFIARKKAIAVSGKLSAQERSEKIIIAADTVVVLDNRIIGKPAGREDAVSILKSLSGQTHRVITGVFVQNGNHEWSFHDITFVEFHELTVEQIIYYVDHYKPYDKAGAYAIQEWIGVTGIKSINGDFYNVMGLPVSRVVKTLQQIR
jgi:septum formation protein